MKTSLLPFVVLLLSPLQLEAQQPLGVIKILLNEGSGDLSTLPCAALLPNQQLDNFPYSTRWGYPSSGSLPASGGPGQRRSRIRRVAVPDDRIRTAAVDTGLAAAAVRPPRRSALSRRSC